MIYLITGNMGTGKSARVVNMMLTNEDGLFRMKAEDGTEIDRPVFFCNIDSLDTKKFSAHELTREQIQAAPLRDVLPQGAVLIVDECHYVYPPRAAASKVPPYVQELTELRHYGFTLILMTQHPQNIDIFVRNLVSKHTHLERKAIGMKQYSWYKCVTNLDNPASISGTESANWKPPEAAFGYYKSSNNHQKFAKKTPLAVWALVAILCFGAWKAYGLYRTYLYHTDVATAETIAASAVTASDTASAPALSEPNAYAAPSQSLRPQDFVPTLAERPESKPIYDSVRQVKSYERIAGCMQQGKSCNCYSDQATKLREISTAMCLDYVRNGLPFDPFREGNPPARPQDRLQEPQRLAQSEQP